MRMRIIRMAVALLTVTVGAALADGGRVVIEGSTTVLPIAQKAAEVFMQKNPSVNITVRGGGSSIGLTSLIDGSCDIADASRAIKLTEIQKAQSRGIDPKANVVAMDGIAVIVNPGNNLTGLSKKQIKDVYTGKITDWSQLGGNSGKIVVVSRDSSSGTFEAFGELVLGKDKVKPGALLQASNQAVASVVTRTPGAIGYVGLGYISDSVKALDVDGVEATVKTVLSGKYPVSRPLFMYTNGSPRGAARSFLDFVMGREGQQIVKEEGFVPLK